MISIELDVEVEVELASANTGDNDATALRYWSARAGVMLFLLTDSSVKSGERSSRPISSGGLTDNAAKYSDDRGSNRMVGGASTVCETTASKMFLLVMVFVF